MWTVDVAKAKPKLTETEPLITSGSINAFQVEFIFNEDWDDLAKFATFRVPGGQIYEVFMEHSTVVNIPWEVLTTAGDTIQVGAYGIKDDGTPVRLPTTWLKITDLMQGVTEGYTPTEPSPDIYQQFVDAIRSRANRLVYDGTNLTLMSDDIPLGSAKIMSPIVQLSQDHANGVVRLIITDVNGVKSASIYDGAVPDVVVTDLPNGHRVTFSVTSHDPAFTPYTRVIDVLNGEQGPQGIQGIQGEKGDTGDAFAVTKIYESYDAMNAGYATDGVKIGQFVMIDTGNVDDEDNARLFVKGPVQYDYITDLSGAQGIQGPVGPRGPQGIQGERGIQGAQGDRGPQGAKGDQGIQGDRGVTGPQGDRGEKGDPGPIGPQGPQGPQGVAGVAVATTGTYAFNVDENGHLIINYTGDEAPPFEINEQGHLILTV